MPIVSVHRNLFRFCHVKTIAFSSCYVKVSSQIIGVTKVGVTRAATNGVTPIFLKNLLVCSSLSLLLISLGCHLPLECVTVPFLPVRPRLSTSYTTSSCSTCMCHLQAAVDMLQNFVGSGVITTTNPRTSEVTRTAIMRRRLQQQTFSQ